MCSSDLRELKQRHGELNRQIQHSLEDEQAGRVAPFDVEEIVAELEAEIDESEIGRASCRERV